MTFELGRFRNHLRAQRESLVGAREKLAELSKINKTTIQNAEMGPDIPGIDTVARLVDAMGLTLSEFFAQLEREFAAASSSVSDNEHATTPSLIGARADASPAVPSPDTLALDELRAFVLRLGEALADAAGPPHETRDRSSTSPRPAQSSDG